MIVKAQGMQAFGATDTVVRLRCPACSHKGTFEPVIPHDIQSNTGILMGIRRCPNTECRAMVFIEWTQGRLMASYPPELIDFDASDIPANVAPALAEAISDHANGCFISAAIMVRKTLELMCHERQATGNNLKDRIQALRTKVVLPNELFEGMDNLRLLGNDAAHIESEVFNQVGKEEVEVGIEFTKELLKAVYQFKQLAARLKALKKPTQ